MGLDFGFNKAKRYKDSSVEDVLRVRRYIDWKNWHSNHYTLEEYLAEFSDCTALPEKDVIDFYMNEEKENGECYENIGNICGWDNSEFSAAIAEDLRESSFEGIYVGVTKEFCERTLSWIDYRLEKNRLIPVTVAGGIYINNSGERVIADLEQLLVCDENDEQKIFDLNDGITIFIPSREYNEYKLSALKNLRNIILEIQEIDLDQYCIWYYVSY